MRSFGAHLLRDSSCAIMGAIFTDENSQESQIWKICVNWLEGEGEEPRTWSTLITILKQAKLRTLAELIESSVDKKALSTSLIS